MKDLYVIVEGQTEQEFVNRLLMPYLYSHGVSGHIQAIMITMSGGGHGFNNIEHFENTITPVLYYRNQPVITSFIDYFRLNSEQKLPGYGECANRCATADERIACLEQKLDKVVQRITPYRWFLPHIAKHEFEALLFADACGFDLEDNCIRTAVAELCRAYPDPEMINETPEGAPSKRLEQIYVACGQRYNKVADGVDIAEMIGIETILATCRHFQGWVERLIAMTQTS